MTDERRYLTVELHVHRQHGPPAQRAVLRTVRVLATTVTGRWDAVEYRLRRQGMVLERETLVAMRPVSR